MCGVVCVCGGGGRGGAWGGVEDATSAVLCLVVLPHADAPLPLPLPPTHCRLAWDASAICNSNPAWGGKGGHKTGDDYPAAPNIDHTQDKIRSDIVQWLGYLKDVGYDGWRFDFVRGYGGQFVKQYVDATVPQLAFGEYWDSCDYSDGVLNYNQGGRAVVGWL